MPTSVPLQCHCSVTAVWLQCHRGNYAGESGAKSRTLHSSSLDHTLRLLQTSEVTATKLVSRWGLLR